MKTRRTITGIKNVVLFTGKTFVGHLGLFIREDNGLNCPVGEDWRHDLFSHPQAIEAILETIAKGDAEGLPQGIYHVYVNATPQGKAEMNVYDCACKHQPTVSRGAAGP